MTKEEFLNDFYCRVSINENETNLQILTEVINRNTHNIEDSVETIINIRKTNNWINDSKTAISLIEWSWESVIDETKRGQLDYFVQRVPITDYYPRSRQENPKIDDMYQ